jgi:hypothetical protein
MDDLLKEAIADAKAVRETALANAKMALEEAFTPRLQNMLSQKIQTEMEDEDEEDMEEREDMMDADEDPSDEDSQEEMAMAMKDADEDPSDEDSEDVDESKIIEIDGVKYAPVVSEEEDEEMEDESEEDDMEEDLDLEAVIKELESELDEAEEEDDDKEEMEEQSTSSGIGKGSSVKQASSSDEEDPQGAKLKEGENPFAKKDDEDDEVDEDIDLDEVLKALSEEEDEDKEKNEVSELKSDLAEHRSVIETLRGKLNEVNLLNAKLLFTNKLFRKHGLNNEQKMKVVEQFDRASNLREVKLVYSTLGESFGARKNEINEHKGSASKPIASTKSEKKVISEGSDLRDRFKKLANLI